MFRLQLLEIEIQYRWLLLGVRSACLNQLILIVVAITYIRMIINRSLLHFYRFYAFSFTFILSIYLCLFCMLTVLANDNYSTNSGAISNPARAESHLYSSGMTLLTFLKKSGGLLSRLLVRDTVAVAPRQQSPMS